MESKGFDFAGTSNKQRFLQNEIIYVQHVIASFILPKFGVLEETSSVNGFRMLCTYYFKNL